MKLKSPIKVFLIFFTFTLLASNDIHSQISQSDFKTAMELLWTNNATLLREVIIDVVDERGNSEQSIENLHKHQTDIGDALKPYYGYEISDKLTRLLDTNVTMAVNFLKAIRSDNADDLENAKQKWYKNTDELVTYLTGINAFLANNELTQLIRDYISSTIDEAITRLKKDSSADTVAYEKAHGLVVTIADMLADAVIKQFPEKFMQKSNF